MSEKLASACKNFILFNVFLNFFKRYMHSVGDFSYIFMVAEAAKKSPELIQLLELHQQFATIAPYSSSQKGGAGGMIEKPQTKADAGCQTDTHILEANLVKDYEWNEWELRRKAIKLVSRNSLEFLCVIFVGGISLIWWLFCYNYDL